MKKLWSILICILINSRCCQENTEDNHDNESFYAKLIKTSEDLTTLGYKIAQFNEKITEVRNAFERQKDFESYLIKVIVNSTEWEIKLHFHDFDEFWKYYTLGKGSDIELYVYWRHCRFETSFAFPIYMEPDIVILI